MIEKKDEYKEFKDYYESRTIIDEIGMFRYEDIHTNFLANLLKSDNIYGLGSKAFELFLKVCGFVGLNDITDVNVSVCRNIGQTNYKPDMIFKFKSRGEEKILLVENKVYSNENIYQINGKNIGQCELYKREMKKKYKDKDVKYVFLYYYCDSTSLKKIKKLGYKEVNYKSLLNKFLEKLKINSDKKYIYDEYVNSYKCFYKREESKCYESIPVSKEGKKLTKKLDVDHKDITDKHLQFVYMINKYNISGGKDESLLDDLRTKKISPCYYNGDKSDMVTIMLNIIKFLNDKEVDISKLRYKDYNIIENSKISVFYGEIKGSKTLDGKFYLDSWYFNQFGDFLDNYFPMEFKKYFNIVTSEKEIRVTEMK